MSELTDRFQTLPIFRTINNSTALTTQQKVKLLDVLLNMFLNDSTRRLFSTPGDNIDRLLTWSNTPQGRDYWERIHTTMQSGRIDPTLVI